MGMRNQSQDKSKKSSPNLPKDCNVSLLIEKIENEQDIDNRSRMIRKLGERNDLQALEYLLKLKRNMDKENEFIQYEIQLSLQQLINNEQLLNNGELNVDFILKNLVLDDDCQFIEPLKQPDHIPQILIDANLLEEFFLRDKTTFFCEANEVIEYILSGQINPYMGVKGVRHIWSSLKEHKGQTFANQLVLELLNKFTVCSVSSDDLQLEKYPNLNIPTVTQIEIARKYNLDGIITLRYRDFIGSDYHYVYSPPMFAKAIKDPNYGLIPLKEKLKKFYEADMIEEKRKELGHILEGKSIDNLRIERGLTLFNGWNINRFEILSSSNCLTSATVILVNEQDNNTYKGTAFKPGSVNALFTAFEEALENIIEEKKHELKEIYVANITPGKEGKVTVQAIVNIGGRNIVTIHTHENILKAYFFAYIKAIIAIYAPDEYKPDVHNQEELMSLYRIGRRDFHQLNFSKIDLTDCEANLANSNLKECNFSEANLSGANLTDTNLKGANFSEADLTNVQLNTDNQTLFTATTLNNTKFPEISISANGKSRIDMVSHLLKHANPEMGQYQILAIHCMITPTWWLTSLGKEFWQVNQQLLRKGIQIQRVFILPRNPEQEHFSILKTQADAGVTIHYLCQHNAENIDHYDLSDINLLICENLSVAQNSFTTKMIFHEQEEPGSYISFQQKEIKTNKELFSLIWENSTPLTEESFHDIHQYN